MNSLFNRLKYFFTYGSKMKRMMLSIVILAEVIVLLVVATYAWVETVSSIKITNAANTTGAIANDTKYTDMLIGDKTGTIDLLDYFEASGDMHLAPASSADGRTFYFPKANNTSGIFYRKGNVSDKNTAYLSATFRLKADTNADFFFWKDTTNDIVVSNDIRVSVTAYTEGDNPEGYYDPSTGKLISNTKIYSNQGGGDAKVIDNVNGTAPSANNTHVEKFSDHQKKTGVSSSARLFAVGANETKIVTINVWLQKTTGNTDITSDMSVSQAIRYLGITSNLTPRHVTLIPTPTWDVSGVNETFYAWCWDATNGDADKLYKLSLDENEHYSFDYNGTYQSALFFRSGNANLTTETMNANNKAAWSNGTIWNKTEDTSIPNDPVDPTFIIKTINGSSEIDPSGGSSSTAKKSTGSWHDPAIIKVAHITDQDEWGTMSATTYIDTSTSSHIMEQTNDGSNPDSVHKDTVHAWPGKKIQLVATAASANYAFEGWYNNKAGTGTALSTSATFTTDAPSTATEITYYAKFKEVRTLTIYRTVDGSTSSTAAAGTITINGSTTANTATSKEVTVDLGSSVTFSAAAEPGYTFDGFYTTATGDSSKLTSPISLNSNTTCYARFTKNISNVTIYIAPREGWGNPDLHIWDDNGVIEDHITADYDGASGYYKVTVQTRGDWVKAVLSKNSSYSGQTSDIEVVSNISVGTNYSKFINTSNTVSNWSSTKRCLWFIITQKGIENNLKNDEDYMQVYVNNADKNMRRINDTAYVVELSNPSGAIDFKQKKSDNSTRNEWGTTVPTSSKSQFKQTTSNSGSWQ